MKDIKSHQKCNIDEDWDTGVTCCMDHEIKLCQACYFEIEEKEITCDKHNYVL